MTKVEPRTVYHYTTFKNLLSILKQKKFVLSEFSKANDWREKYANTLFSSLSFEKYRYLSTSSRYGFDRLSPCIPSMWYHYADDHKGVCIGFNAQSLKSKCDFCGYIQYKNGLPKTDCTFDEYIMTKSECWSNEYEYRFVWKSGISSISNIGNYIEEIHFGGSYKLDNILSIINNDETLSHMDNSIFKLCWIHEDGIISSLSVSDLNVKSNVFNNTI